MTGGKGSPPAARVLINEIEGHLLVAAAQAQGRTAAARFTAPFDWLDDDRRREVEERFEAEYLALARSSWQRTAERAGRLRGEYEGGTARCGAGCWPGSCWGRARCSGARASCCWSRPWGAGSQRAVGLQPGGRSRDRSWRTSSSTTSSRVASTQPAL